MPEGMDFSKMMESMGGGMGAGPSGAGDDGKAVANFSRTFSHDIYSQARTILTMTVSSHVFFHGFSYLVGCLLVGYYIVFLLVHQSEPCALSISLQY